MIIAMLWMVGLPVADGRSSSSAAGTEFELFMDLVADRIATKVIARIAVEADARGDRWLDSKAAAEYLGIHRDTLRKLAAAGVIKSEQEGPGCKRYFRAGELDQWRGVGGFHSASNVAKNPLLAGHSG
jgi:excisionase family DNA binding protein